MSSRKETPPADRDELTELRHEVADLKNHLRLLVDAIDEIRDELQYLNINGIRTREPLPAVPVLKRMALDPCAIDWNERLVMDFGPSNGATEAGRSGPSKLPDADLGNKTVAGRPATNPSEQRELF